MHNTTLFLVLWGFLGVASAEQIQYVQPVRDSVPVYAKEVRPLFAQPVFKAQAGDRLLVLARGLQKLQVKDSRGKTGWIDQQLVRSVRGSQLIFQGMNVDPGYIDNPTIIFISGTDSRDDERILLERSFAEALRDNTDRESVERSAVPAK
jgi:hypothetical protein